jgi:hypothetical protein
MYAKVSMFFYDSKEQQPKGLNMRTAYLTSLLIGAMLSLIYIFQTSYSSSMSLISGIFLLASSITALASAAFALRKYWKNLRDRYSQIWLFFTAGLLIWFVSKASWSIYTLSLSPEAPYPSVADILWLAGYVPIFAAIHSYLRSFGFSLSKLRYSAFAATVSLVLLAAFVLLTPPVAAANDEAFVLLSIVYLGLDLSLLSLSIHGLFVFFNGKIGVAWAFLSSALFLNAVGDMLFSYATQNGTYYSGHGLELLFHFSYLFCTLAFYTHVKEL